MKKIAMRLIVVALVVFSFVFIVNYRIVSAACPISGSTVQDRTNPAITYGIVAGADGNCWLDRNLGATRVATAFNDSQAYGWLFQWGRGADGHQVISSGTTTVLSSSDSPGHANFIANNSGNFDWRNPQNNNLWQGDNGINNPCPIGFRLPTKSEWSTIRTAAEIYNNNSAFSSSLKLTAAGIRRYNDTLIYRQGQTSDYWSNASTFAFSIMSTGSAASVFRQNANGLSVRCIGINLVDNGCAADTCNTTQCWNSYQWVNGAMICADNSCAANICSNQICWNNIAWISGTKNPTFSNYLCNESDSLNCSLSENCGKTNNIIASCTAINSCTGETDSRPITECGSCSSSIIQCPACSSVSSGTWREVAP